MKVREEAAIDWVGMVPINLQGKVGHNLLPILVHIQAEIVHVQETAYDLGCIVTPDHFLNIT